MQTHSVLKVYTSGTAAIFKVTVHLECISRMSSIWINPVSTCIEINNTNDLMCVFV